MNFIAGSKTANGTEEIRGGTAKHVRNTLPASAETVKSYGFMPSAWAATMKSHEIMPSARAATMKSREIMLSARAATMKSREIMLSAQAATMKPAGNADLLCWGLGIRDWGSDKEVI